MDFHNVPSLIFYLHTFFCPEIKQEGHIKYPIFMYSLISMKARLLNRFYLPIANRATLAIETDSDFHYRKTA